MPNPSFQVHYSGLVQRPSATAAVAAAPHPPRRMYPLHELYLVRDETGSKAALHTFGENAAVHVGTCTSSGTSTTEGVGYGEVSKVHMDSICPTCGRHYSDADAISQKGRCVDCVLCPRCGVKTTTMMKETTFEALLQCTNCSWSTDVFKGLTELNMSLKENGYTHQAALKERHRTLENAHQLSNNHVVSISNEARGVHVYSSHHPCRTASTVALIKSNNTTSTKDDVDEEDLDDVVKSTLAQLMTSGDGGPLTNDSIASGSSSTAGYQSGMRILGNFSFTSIAATASTRATHTMKLEGKLQAAATSRKEGAPVAVDVSTLTTTALPHDFSEVSTGGRKHIATFPNKASSPTKSSPTPVTLGSNNQGDGVFVNVMKFIGAGGGGRSGVSTSKMISEMSTGPFTYDQDIFTFKVPGRDAGAPAAKHTTLPTACVPDTVHPNITALSTCKRASSHLLQQALTITSAHLYPSSLADGSDPSAPTPTGAATPSMQHTKQMNRALQGFLSGSRTVSLAAQGYMSGPASQLVQNSHLLSRGAVILTHPLYSSIDASTALHLPAASDVVAAVAASPARSKGGDMASSAPGSAYLYVPNPKGILDSNTTGGLLSRDRNPNLAINMNAGRVLPHIMLSSIVDIHNDTTTKKGDDGEGVDGAAASEATATSSSSSVPSSRLMMCYLWNFSGNDIKILEVSVVSTKGCNAVCSCAVPTPLPPPGEEDGDEDEGELMDTSSSTTPSIKPITMFLTSRSNDIESLGSNNSVSTREQEGLTASVAAIKAIHADPTNTSNSSPSPTFYPCESRVLFGIDVTDKVATTTTTPGGNKKMVCLKITAVVSVGRNAKVQTSYLSYLTFI